MKIEAGNILVVDDNEMNRDMLSRRLIKQGHIVELAEDGKKALELIESKKYDLVLLDIMMPEISGLEALTFLRKKYTVADLPIIMVTAKDQSEDVVEALKLGANDYVTKPVDFPVASARIQTQLRLKRLAELKDEFIRIASHDLKNPLSGILGYASVLRMTLNKDDAKDKPMFDCASRIEHLSLVMNRIILDFLDFQAMDDGHLNLLVKATQVNQLVEEVLTNNLEYAKSKGIELKLDLAIDLKEISVDSSRVEQVLENLVGNAIKFSSEGSVVLIHSQNESDSVLVEVRDSGPGLTEEDMTKLFIQYARLSNKPTGGEKSSGLGLAICKKIINLHGGKIGARNNPDKGTTFWFQLPPNPPEQN